MGNGADMLPRSAGRERLKDTVRLSLEANMPKSMSKLCIFSADALRCADIVYGESAKGESVYFSLSADALRGPLNGNYRKDTSVSFFRGEICLKSMSKLLFLGYLPLK